VPVGAAVETALLWRRAGRRVVVAVVDERPAVVQPAHEGKRGQGRDDVVQDDAAVDVDHPQHAVL
jgi:hypothetical protein